jgi:hypothetical protein
MVERSIISPKPSDQYLGIRVIGLEKCGDTSQIVSHVLALTPQIDLDNNKTRVPHLLSHYHRKTMPNELLPDYGL